MDFPYIKGLRECPTRVSRNPDYLFKFPKRLVDDRWLCPDRTAGRDLSFLQGTDDDGEEIGGNGDGLKLEKSISRKGTKR